MSKRHPICQPVCLAVILGLGIQVAVAFVVGWIAFTSAQMKLSHTSGRIIQTLRFIVDGTPVIRTLKSDSNGYPETSFSTLEGTPVDPTRAAALEFLSTEYLPGPPPETVFLVRPSWGQRVIGFNVGGIFWYFVHDGKKAGSGYFVGFDSKSKRRIGYVGLHGACADLPSDDDRFPLAGDKISRNCGIATVSNFAPGYAPIWEAPATDRSNIPYWKVYLLSENRLLEVDLRDRSVRTVLEADGMISIVVLRRDARGRDEQSEAGPLVASRDIRLLTVRTADSVIVVDPSSGERLVYPIPAQIGRRSMQFLQLSDATLLVSVSGKKLAGSVPNDLFWIRPGGQVQRHARISLLQPNVGQLDDRVVSGLAGIAAPLPVAWAAGVVAIGPALHIAYDDAADYATALAESLAQLWPGLLISFVLAALAVWLCIRRQRRYAMPSTRTWVVVMLLFGLPAYLGYLFHRTWPARIKCPACGKPAPRDRETCPECHVPYPDPEATGVEVFA